MTYWTCSTWDSLSVTPKGSTLSPLAVLIRGSTRCCDLLCDTITHYVVHGGGFLRPVLRALTIHTPSNGTLSWNFLKLSCHHSCVASLEKSGYAVRPGHTYRKKPGGSSEQRLHSIRQSNSSTFNSTGNKNQEQLQSVICHPGNHQASFTVWTSGFQYILHKVHMYIIQL